MQALAVPLQGLITTVKDNANAMVFSVLIFSYQALENGFPCSCKPEPGYCSLYMSAPCLIVTVLMLSTDVSFQRAWRYTCSKGSGHFSGVLLRRLVKALCVGLLWVVSVLIDAEWFVCCRNPNPKTEADLQCKDKSDSTDPSVVTIADMKQNSRMYGLALLLGITFVGAFLLSTWTICANESCCPTCCTRNVKVDELMLEVGENVSAIMKEKQKEWLSGKVDKYIEEKQWVKCLDVVEEFIRQEGGRSGSSTRTPPEIPLQNLTGNQGWRECCPRRRQYLQMFL
ncbi:uncharacterized protein LOC114558607 [Perca flavescens]|uniref:uncharacterized protein LOC114558607 n=1 Tax=Perca flavescens TaxID=8167 RepID=UPI00106E8C8E|nr:uncharacterized protein LOC114558607 [Perca flavescens]